MQKPSKIDKRSTKIEINQQTSSKTNITGEFSIKCIRFIHNITFKLLPAFRMQNLSPRPGSSKMQNQSQLSILCAGFVRPQKQKLFGTTHRRFIAQNELWVVDSFHKKTR